MSFKKLIMTVEIELSSEDDNKTEVVSRKLTAQLAKTVNTVLRRDRNNIFTNSHEVFCKMTTTVKCD